MFWVKTADFISDRSWPVSYQKMVFKSRGQITTWLYADDVNYVILVASWIIQTKQLWRRARKHRKRREEEGGIAPLEPQTSEVVKIRHLRLEYVCTSFHLIRLFYIRLGDVKRLLICVSRSNYQLSLTLFMGIEACTLIWFYESIAFRSFTVLLMDEWFVLLLDSSLLPLR